MSWQDYIRIAGMPGNTPSAEVFQGIGSQSLKWDRSELENVLADWDSAIALWFSDAFDWLRAQQAAYANGTYTPSEFPVANLFLTEISRSNIFFLSIEHLQIQLIKRILQGLVNGPCKQLIISAEAELGLDGGGQPLLKVFRKFAFLKDGDKEQGFPLLTSLLLLNADKPIEIYTTHEGLNVFLDTVVRTEEEGPS